MSATIRDVARRAGVGLGTVSRVLNNSPLVSAATRQRVLEAIADLRYRPSQIARSFASGRTLMIATITPFLTRPSVVERLRGIEATLAISGYDLVVFNVETVERRNACMHDVPRRDRADGALIISLTPHAAEVQRFQSIDVPVVLIDATAEGMHAVAIDNVRGGELATRYLIELGHRRIGFVGDSPEETAAFNFTSSHDRQRGYLAMLQQAHIPYEPAYVCCGLHGRFEARLLARDLLLQPEPPTAIFAASDTQAMGVLEAARDLGRRVPDELSVLGFDDIDTAEHLGLSTVRQPLFESGARGADLLLAQLTDAAPAARLEYLPIELVPRTTTGPPT